VTGSIQIGEHAVGLAHPTYFVADVAANHDGDLDRARDLIKLAAEAGADAAKFQHFKAETIVSATGFSRLGSQVAHQAAWTKDVVEVYRDASIPADWTAQLRDACDLAGLDFFTSAYDLDLIDEVAPYVCAWKVGSGDITWTDAIERMAATGKPVLIATGASTIDDVRRAVTDARRHTDAIVVMQCNTNYTGSADNFAYIELNVLKAFAREFPDVVLGLSDHTPGLTTVLGAVALGARVIEKHFTDDRRRDGPDHGFSMEPKDWRDMVDRTRELEAALGGEDKHVMANELETVVVQRRAIRSARPLSAGTTLASTDLAFLRPCPPGSLAPHQSGEIVGRELARDIDAGDVVTLDDLV
jgi:N-acetylneuraminate synthase